MIDPQNLQTTQIVICYVPSRTENNLGNIVFLHCDIKDPTDWERGLNWFNS